MNTFASDRNDPVCVILAAGRGTRMSSPDRHKVCFDVAGVPAIVRAIDAYKQAGLERFVVVVGHMADQVKDTVSAKHPGVSYVFQPEPRGTGHAAGVAVEALAARGHRGKVVIVLGDKVVTADVVERFLERLDGSDADLVLTTLPHDSASSSGRVVSDGEGAVVGVVEVADLRKAEAEGRGIGVGNRALTSEEIEERSLGLNVSMYGFRIGPLQEALQHLDGRNAQGELYLTDTVEYLAARGPVDVFHVADPSELMAFDTPQDLLAIEEVLRVRKATIHERETATSPRSMRPIGAWQALLDGRGGDLRETLRQFYGSEPAVVEERRSSMLELIDATARALGSERPVVLYRAPGRINLMGRHVDHRGGYVNVMAVGRELLLAASPREDDVVTLRNVDPGLFPDREFRIGDNGSWSDWNEFVDSTTVRRALDLSPGDWAHYARAPVLRLQHHFSDLRLNGMDCIVSGNIPTGAGMASSSAVVVAFAGALAALNGLDISPEEFVDLCGEGEWFVGSRGGSADHAAIATSLPGHVSRMGFLPFHRESDVPLPDDLDVVVADSGDKALKTEEARDTYNQRVACYEIAEVLLRHGWPGARKMEHLRDLASDDLGVSPSDVYRALARLPDRPSRRQLNEIIPAEQLPRLETLFSTHRNLGRYDLRGVALFGIAECARSDRFAEMLRRRDLLGIGEMMRTSHDGDRRWRTGASGEMRRFLVRTDTSTLERMAASEADLAAQPGRYACSTKTIDRLVDVANATEGVVGAQLAGAGLGGCMMALVHREHRDTIVERLEAELANAANGPTDVFVCHPVAGAGLLGV